MKRFPLDARRVPCRVDPEPFFDRDPELQAAAARLCAACPLRDDCLELARSAGERVGVWGGVIFGGTAGRGPERQTLCKRGHVLEGANVRVSAHGRQCLECMRERERRRRRERAELKRLAREQQEQVAS